MGKWYSIRLSYYNVSGKKYDTEVHEFNADEPYKVRELMEFIVMKAMLEMFNELKNPNHAGDERSADTILIELVDDDGCILRTARVDYNDMRKLVPYDA